MSTVTQLPEATPLTVRVAEEVRALMGRHRVSQTKLAEVLGFSQPQMSARLRGKIPFDVNELEVIARHFNVSPAALLGLASGGTDGGPGAAMVTFQYPVLAAA